MKMDLRAIGIPFSADGRRAAIVLPYIDTERDLEIIHEQIELEETKSKQRPDAPSQLTKNMEDLKADPESAAVFANLKKHWDNE